MKIIGLTGQSGAGKTSVCGYFAENGFKIINADKIAREVMEKNSSCLSETVSFFGEEILNADKTLNRKRLADIVFSDREKLLNLNEISYKYINAEVNFLLGKFSSENEEYVIIDAPTLFEAGEDRLCRTVVGVIADERIRLERIMRRDNISETDALKRFGSQHTEDFFREKCGLIIENNGTEKELLKKTKEITEKLKE